MEFINQQVYLLFYSIRTDFLNSLFVSITSFGNYFFSSIVALVALYYLMKLNKKRLALFLLSNIFIGQILTYILKFSINSPRPSLVRALVVENDPSFPSAHTMIAITLYFSLFIFISRNYIKTTKLLRILLMIFLGALVIVIPLSRLYLGVHWFSDIIGATFLGLFQTLLLLGAFKLKLPKNDKIYQLIKSFKFLNK